MENKYSIEKDKIIDRAKKYLRGEDIFGEGLQKEVSFKQLQDKLVFYEQFGYLVEILIKKIDENVKKGIHTPISDYQKLARNIYKDTTLSSYFKYDKALNVLKSYCDLGNSEDCETLGLAGAIYKYKWKFNYQFTNLLHSRAYYQKGYNIWKKSVNINPRVEKDYAYTAINYAYLTELILVENLRQQSEISVITEEFGRRFDLAQSVRTEILNAFLDNSESNQPQIKSEVVEPNEWLYATIAEAYFGLRKYKQALYFIEQYLQNKNEYWQIKTFIEQLYHISFFQEVEKKYRSDSFKVKEIIDVDRISCLSALNLNSNYDSGLTPQKYQKIGLGLSGGGFRAALFHIGVLAALAEHDILKNVEIISCVSGGSIIGAYYYLKLKQLLENTEDKDINRDSYVKLVQEVEKEFLEAVQKNVRMHLFTNISKNFKMFFDEEYTRSHRLGELYEELFYKDFKEKHMNDLIIRPYNETDFNINNDNWLRKNKIPQLVLNATAVNTGHNWQFTASWMGEPPTFISDDFDVKPRLRRMYYQNAPEEYQQFKLGFAVAASSCVPVLFEPLILKGLYEDFDLELVDGGIHDNQGIASILEQECNQVIISDGSSQLPNNSKSDANALSLYYRVDNILQERLRETQLMDLKSREYAAALKELYIVHLKNELNQLPVNWEKCTDVSRSVLYDKEIVEENALLKYGLMKKVQVLLSQVRTDLDSFNDLEANALMFSGYQQMKHSKLLTNREFEEPANWNFLNIKKYCQEPSREEKLIKQLTISQDLFFKILKLSKPLSITVKALELILMLGILYFLYFLWGNRNNPVPIYSLTYQIVVFFIIVFLLGYISKYLSIIVNWQGWIKKKVVLVATVIIGWIVSNLYIWFLNPLYNKLGKMEKEK